MWHQKERPVIHLGSRAFLLREPYATFTEQPSLSFQKDDAFSEHLNGIDASCIAAHTYPVFVRIRPSIWMSIHSSVGWVLVVATAIRFLTLALRYSEGKVRIFRRRGLHAVNKMLLLV
jgi:hypothetical protein